MKKLTKKVCTDKMKGSNYEMKTRIKETEDNCKNSAKESSELNEANIVDDNGVKPRFNENESLLCFDGKLFNEAICLNDELKDNRNQYYIRYNNDDREEWIHEWRLMKLTEQNIGAHYELIESLTIKSDHKELASNDRETLAKFGTNETVLAFDGKRMYEAVCLSSETRDENIEYCVHYPVFGKRFDEWLTEPNIMKLNKANLMNHRTLVEDSQFVRLYQLCCGYDKAVIQSTDIDCELKACVVSDLIEQTLTGFSDTLLSALIETNESINKILDTQQQIVTRKSTSRIGDFVGKTLIILLYIQLIAFVYMICVNGWYYWYEHAFIYETDGVIATLYNTTQYFTQQLKRYALENLPTFLNPFLLFR